MEPNAPLHPASDKNTHQPTTDNAPNQSAKTKLNRIEVPSVTLPKGGGAVKSIDEKFSVNSSNGTASFSIPLPFSPGRNGFIPPVSLSYNSGSGNSIVGLGWEMGLPVIQRKLDKKLPEYNDADESDTFLFSGVEDLVPELEKDNNGNLVKKIITHNHVTKKFYRPRIEGSFAHIEKIQEGKNCYWQVSTRQNEVFVFGKSDSAKLFSPVRGEEYKIFKWCLEYSYDDKGNLVVYSYKKETTDGVASTLYEQNRLNGNAPFNNIYLKSVRYGHKDPWKPGDAFPAEFFFQTVFDYGEHEQHKPTTNEVQKWNVRADAFSDYRPGFELRTYRLCRRVLMFHHFKNELGFEDYLVRSLDFDYEEQPHLTFLKNIVQSGYIWNEDGSLRSKKSLPPLEFAYSRPAFSREVKSIDTESLEGDPAGVDNHLYQWIDLYSEGIAGILTEQAGGWYYKKNIGEGKLAPPSLVSPKPSFPGLTDGNVILQELEANGKKFAVTSVAGTKGFFELNTGQQWQSFYSFDSCPNIDFKDANLKYIDLDGDGMPDLLISKEQQFVWYAAKGKAGYDDYQVAAKAADEEKGPRIVFANKDQRMLIAVADMNGDGLSDILIITGCGVSYYPNLGYGRFGARVTMHLPKRFDLTGSFNPNHIYLADIDGSGTTDIIYSAKNKIQVWYNQSGNSLTGPDEFLNPFPQMNDQSKFSFVDLLGNGTACLVCSSALNSNTPLQYVDWMGGKKPYVLSRYSNNLGKEIILEYKPSTFYYLKDQADGKKWITQLPFPVQCISKVMVKDRISKTCFTNEYTYHHGYYDSTEREFRGFGRVDKLDTDLFNKENLDQHPVLTKTWFHTGVAINREKIYSQFEDEYFFNDPRVKKLLDQSGIKVEEKLLPDLPLDPTLTNEEWREALRACKGIPLRIEVFAVDNSDKSLFPYTSTGSNFGITMIQPKNKNKHAVFFVQPSESLTYNYERNPDDPRVSHSLTLKTDQYGNVLESASIACRRKKADPQLTVAETKKQQTTHITYTVNRFTNDQVSEEGYRLRLPFESCSYELTCKEPDDFYLTKENLVAMFVAAAEIRYEETPDRINIQKRLIERTRSVFLKDDLSGPCKIGELSLLALPYESYQLAFTKFLSEKRFNEPGKIRVDHNLLTAVAKYVNLPDDEGMPVNQNNYWIPSGRQQFDPGHFFQVTKIMDAFNFPVTIEYDNDYRFFVQKITDAAGNSSGVAIANGKPCFNYRTLHPFVVQDANDNRTGVRSDEIGMICMSFTMGKENENLGDFLDTATPEISINDKPTSRLEYTIDSWHNQLKALPQNFDPDKDNYTPLPNFIKLFLREQHHFENANSPWQISYSYSDGSGHEIMRKVQADPGLAPQRDANGNLLLDPQGQVTLAASDPRWIGTGRTILNNKGNPVRQYEPFFSSGFHFEDENEMVRQGVTPVIHYDALGRVIKTISPDGSFSEVQFDSWHQKTYDQNDTVGRSDWYDQRIVHPVATVATPEEKEAAQKALWHKETPTVSILDSLGSIFLTIVDNSAFGKYRTLSETDLEGNLRHVTDAMGNLVMEFEYDMLGNVVVQNSYDAGVRRVLNNVTGKNIRTWSARDSIDFVFTNEYDQLHRPTQMSFIRNNNQPVLYQNIVYGGKADKNTNRCGKPIQQKDTAGIVTNVAFDFKGNLVSSSRQLIKNYDVEVNWNTITNADLEDEIFFSSTVFDALNRIVKLFTPSTSPATTNVKASQITPAYNITGLLRSVSLQLPGNNAQMEVVKKITYDAKSQRESITYGNDTITTYKYNPKTFRLINLLTTDKNGGLTFQDLKYTYDPVGNITLLRDNAQQTIFFGNKIVEPKHDYVYDAIYRLVEASGREHIGQNILNESQTNTNIRNFPFNAFIQNIPKPTDAVAMRNYKQQFSYDSVGNIKSLDHKGFNPDNSVTGFKRVYYYNNNDTDRTACNVQGNPVKNNQLLRTRINADQIDYTHDDRGNIISLPHLSDLVWNFKDQLFKTKQTAGGTGENTFYVYDGNGRRVRKITQRQNSAQKKDERIYLNGFEIYRSYNNGTLTLQRESLHVMDDRRRVALIETKTVENGSDDTTILNKPVFRYQYNDHLGSASLELDENFKIISYEEFHPFGTTSYHATESSQQVPKKRYRYTGMERDDENGFNYHGARYYIPWLARWLNPDPLGISDGLNLYQYVKNNPVGFIDKTGTQQKSVCYIDPAHPSCVICTPVEEEIQEVVVRGKPREKPKEDKTKEDKPSETDKPAPAEEQESTGEKVADVVTDFIPIVGGAKDIYRGVKQGKTWMVALGVGSIVLDVFTLGGGSLVKGGLKTGLKQGAKVVAKEVAEKEAAELLAKEVAEKAAKEAAEKAAKEAAEKAAKEAAEKAAKEAAEKAAKEAAEKAAKEGAEKTVKYASPSVLGTLVGTSRSQMRRAAAKKIAQTPNHPLKFLLDKFGKFKSSKGLKHAELINRPDVLEMGHITSNLAGGTEKLMLQAAWENQFSRVTVEGIGKGAFIENVAVDIGGIAVDLQSAKWWEAIGLLAKGTVENAPRLVF